MRYRYLINSHEEYAVGKKSKEIHPRMALYISCSIWRIGYVLRIKRIRPDRYFRKLGKSREYIAPVEGSRRKGAKLRAQERENPFSAARLRSSPRSGGFQRAAARPAPYETTVKWGARFNRISGWPKRWSGEFVSRGRIKWSLMRVRNHRFAWKKRFIKYINICP